MENRFKLYIISSPLNLEELYKIILNHSPSGLDVGPIRTIFIRDYKNGSYKKTNNKFILTTKDVYNRLIIAGFGNKNNNVIFISEYIIKNTDNAPSDSLMHYYFPNSESNKLEITKKIKFLETMKFFTSDDYIIYNNIIEFSDKVNPNIRIIIKLIIDTTECRVSWCKKYFFNNLRKNEK